MNAAGARCPTTAPPIAPTAASVVTAPRLSEPLSPPVTRLPTPPPTAPDTDPATMVAHVPHSVAATPPAAPPTIAPAYTDDELSRQFQASIPTCMTSPITAPAAAPPSWKATVPLGSVIERIITDIRIGVGAPAVPDRVNLQEAPHHWRVHPSAVVVQPAGLGIDALAGVAEGAAGRGARAIRQIAGLGERRCLSRAPR